ILTELGFAAILGAGFVLYRDRKPRAAALVWSLLPLARPEGFFLAPFLGLALVASPAAHPARPFSLPRLACAALLASGTAAWWRSRPRAGRLARSLPAAVVSLALLAGIVVTPHSGPVRGDSDAKMIQAIWPWCAERLVRDPSLRFVADHPFFFVPGDVDRGR